MSCSRTHAGNAVRRAGTGAAVWLSFAGLWALGLLIARRRHRKYGEMLRAAGITWPRT